VTPRFWNGDVAKRYYISWGSQNVIISYNVQESKMKTRSKMVTFQEKLNNLCIMQENVAVKGKFAWINKKRSFEKFPG